MKILVKESAAKRLRARLFDASEYFDSPATCTVWLENADDPVTGKLLNPEFPKGDRIPFHPGLDVLEDGNEVYRNCYGETLAVSDNNGTSWVLTGRRHQNLYGAPGMEHEDRDSDEIEGIQTSRPDLKWWQTATSNQEG